MTELFSETDMKIKIPVLIAFLIIGTSASAETLRCGSKIVDVGMNMDEVRKYCGKPSSTAVEEQDVRSGNRVVGKTQLNIWQYRRSSGQRTAVLQFDQDKLISIRYISK
jgi:uncharacterized protein DUF2845